MTLFILSILYFSILLAHLYLIVMQVGFVRDHLRVAPVLLSSGAFVEAGHYEIAKERLGIVELLWEAVLFVAWIGGGFALLAGALESVGDPWGSVLFFIAFLLLSHLFALPVQLYRLFVLEKRFGFSRMTMPLFMADEFKKGLLLVLLGGAAAYGVIWIMQEVALWWAWGAGLLVALLVATNLLYPTFIAPLFNRFSPLPEGELRTRIEEMLSAHGLQSSGLFVVDSSRRDTRLNAYFAGLGRAKRVVLYDTLIEKLSTEELAAVLGHELGHLTHRDLWVRLVTSSLLVTGLFVLAGNLPEVLFGQMGLEASAGAKLAVLWLIASPLMLVVMPLLHLIYRRAEYAADRHGAQTVSAQALGSALVRLGAENKKFPYVHPWYEAIFYSHPSLLRRLEALGYDAR